MNSLRKKRIGSVLKYTWPIYIVSGVIVVLALHIIFGVTHRLPGYKTLTLFVSGQMKNSDKLEKDLLEEFKEKELKSFSCISADPSDGAYEAMLRIPGMNSADVLIVPNSKLEELGEVIRSEFALTFSNELIESYFTGLTLYGEDDAKYGVKLDKDKVSEYMTLPDEDCYLLLNEASYNIGEYSKKPVKEHDNALVIVQNWGM